MDRADVLVISPMRRPDWRHAITPSHPFAEPLDSPPFTAAAVCEHAGLSTAVLALQNIYVGFDPEHDLRELSELLRAVRPCLVLFASDPLIASRSTATVYGMQVVTGLLADQTPQPVIGACGRLATTAPLRVLEAVAGLDFIIIGEAEETLSEIAVAAAQKGVDGLNDHPNVLTRPAVAAGRTRATAAFVADPNLLPLPAFHLAGPSVELTRQRMTFPTAQIPFSVRTSFGCKFRCRFCAGVPHWRDYRTKSRSHIAAEIDHLRMTLSDTARVSFFEDEIATRHQAHVEGFAAVLRERGILLDGLYTHASLLTPSIAELLAPITRRVFLGMDSASDTILQQMGKGQRVETVLEAAQIARAAGLRTHLEWIIGSPPDTIDSLITSLHSICLLLATGIVESINTYVYCPHPGTAYAERAADHQMVIHEPFHMLESGGYPASSSSRLTRNQTFTAYLMSQLVIGEIQQARDRGGPVASVRPPARAELRRLFQQIGEPS